MTKWRAFCRSFHKNVIVKKKYKAFGHLLFDREYRASIEKLHQLTKNCTKNEVKPVHIDDLVPGHKIVYPAYALSLFGVANNLPKIRVVYDNERHKYVVVDGNHRLPALILYASTRGLYKDVLFCEVIS